MHHDPAHVFEGVYHNAGTHPGKAEWCADPAVVESVAGRTGIDLRRLAEYVAAGNAGNPVLDRR